MNSSTVTLLWTPWTLAISIAIWCITAVVSYLAWRRSGYRTGVAVLEGLRLGIIALIGLLLNQPEWVEEYQREGKPKIAVLIDQSKSLQTADVAPEGDASAPMLTRASLVEPLLQHSTWRALEERFDVQVQAIGNSKTAAGTDLSTPLVDAAKNLDELLGIVLVSDGDWTEGEPPINAANKLRMANIPVVSVPVGSPLKLPDVELKAISAPSIAVLGKDVRIPFTVESSLPREFTATVTLTSSGSHEATTEIRIAANSRTEGSVIWRPDLAGTFRVTVSLPAQNDELIPDNNEASATISVREERIKALIVETYPRWEYRYLRNALSRDPGVEVSCLLYQTGMKKLGGGNKDYIKSFPESRELLAEYDVVFLGDVGIDDGQLTVEQCDWITGLVEHQASGLVFLPGSQGRQLELLITSLQKLYPVIPDESQPRGVYSDLAGQMELTDVGRKSLLTRLGATDVENFAIWEQLPGFFWRAPVVRAKVGAETIAVHQTERNADGRIPLLVSQTYGTGKVLFMGTDGAWRWRLGVEDKFHYRFWGQVIRWMAYQRNMAEGESMRLYHSPDVPKMRQTVALQANVLGPNGAPLTAGDVIANIVSPSGEKSAVRFSSVGGEWGAFSSTYRPTEPGEHKIELHCRQTGASLESTLFIQDEPLEVVGRPARPEVLEEIAAVTRGAVLQPTEVKDVVKYLSDLPDRPPSVRRLQMWSHPMTIAVVVSALGVYWVGRKTIGLI